MTQIHRARNTSAASRRLTALALSLLLLASVSSLSSEAAHAASAGAFGCAPASGTDHYTVLNARGSREGGTAAQASAFKPNNRPDYAERVQLQTSRAVDVKAIEQRLAARSAAKGRRALFVHLELSYPAWLGTTTPTNGTALRASLDTYQASVAKGLASLEQAADAAFISCPSTRIIALGYSQGAEVLQRFMSRARNDKYAKMTTSVILIGNPLRDVASSAVTYDPGTQAVTAKGLTWYARGAVPVRAAWRGKVSDFCYSRDQICALPAATGSVVKRAVAGNQFTSAQAATYRGISWTEHSNYPAAFRAAILQRF